MKPPEHHFVNEYGQREVKRMWLGSGVDDHGGDEIHEGDRVSVSEHKHPFTVMFADGKFWLGNSRMKCHLTYFHNSKIEVVGHIAEEGNNHVDC